MAVVAAQASHVRPLLPTLKAPVLPLFTVQRPLPFSLSRLSVTYLAILVAPALMWAGFQLPLAHCTQPLRC